MSKPRAGPERVAVQVIADELDQLGTATRCCGRRCTAQAEAAVPGVSARSQDGEIYHRPGPPTRASSMLKITWTAETARLMCAILPLGSVRDQVMASLTATTIGHSETPASFLRLPTSGQAELARDPLLSGSRSGTKGRPVTMSRVPSIRMKIHMELRGCAEYGFNVRPRCPTLQPSSGSDTVLPSRAGNTGAPCCYQIAPASG